jgi:glycine cleavage system regulatory protein
MNVPLVMTIIGRDRTGLVESLANIVAEYGGNWLESRMCRLGGEFAGILRVHVPAEHQPAMLEALQGLQARGLRVVALPDQADSTLIAGKPASVEIIGQDRPGIVRQITHAVASHGVNVEELATECVSAPMSGETLFKAQARLRIPDGCDVAALRAELERIAADLMVDISFAELAESR